MYLNKGECVIPAKSWESSLATSIRVFCELQKRAPEPTVEISLGSVSVEWNAIVNPKELAGEWNLSGNILHIFHSSTLNISLVSLRVNIFR